MQNGTPTHSSDALGLWPCLVQIDAYLGTNKEHNEWYKALKRYDISTLEQAARYPSEDWIKNLQIPLRILVELKAILKAYSSLPPAKDRRSILKQSKVEYSSFEDLNAFVRPRLKEEEFGSISKKKKPNRLSIMRVRSETTKESKLEKISSNLSNQRIRGKVNVIGRKNHPLRLLHQALGHQNCNVNRPFFMDFELYDKAVELEIRSTSHASDCDIAVLVFARNSLRSYTKLLDKFFQTIAKDPTGPIVPILLVGIIVDNPGAKTKYVKPELGMQGLEIMQGLRYIEVTTAADGKGVFKEIARILIRDIHTFTGVKLEEMKGKLQKAKKSEELLLRKKGIKFLPNLILPVCPTLKRLRLDGNFLSHFPNCILYCPQLTELSLANNAIRRIPDQISKLVSLVRLDVENNQIDSLPIGELQKLRKLQEFKTAGNPLSDVPEGLLNKKVVKLELLKEFQARSVAPNKDSDLQNLSITEKPRDPFPIFNISLESLMLCEYDLYPLINSPRYVRDTFNFIVTRGICAEGIFRVAGSGAECDALREDIDKSIDFQFKKDESPHNVTSIFKQWLREFDEPLLLFENYDKIMALRQVASPDAQLATLKDIFLNLPRTNFTIVRLIFRLMYIIGQNQHTNRMGYSNVAKVIGPNLALSGKEDSDPMETMNQVNFINDLFSQAAEHFPTLFEHEENLFTCDALQNNQTSSIFFRKLTGHEKSIFASSLSSTGLYLWTVDTSPSIRIWNTRTNQPVPIHPIVNDSITEKNCILNRIEDVMWVASSQKILLLKENDGELIAEIKLPADPADPKSISRPFSMVTVGDTVWVSRENGDILSFHKDTYEMKIIKEKGGAYVVLQMASVKNSIWWHCSDRHIRVWGLILKDVVAEIECNSRVNAFSFIGMHMWVCLDNASIVIYDTKKNEEIKTLDDHHKMKVFGAVAVGNAVWTFSWDSQIHVYGAETFEYIETLPTYHSDAISFVHAIEDEENQCHKVFTVSWDKTVTVWLAKKTLSC